MSVYVVIQLDPIYVDESNDELADASNILHAFGSMKSAIEFMLIEYVENHLDTWNDMFDVPDISGRSSMEDPFFDDVEITKRCGKSHEERLKMYNTKEWDPFFRTVLKPILRELFGARFVKLLVVNKSPKNGFVAKIDGEGGFSYGITKVPHN